MIYFNKHSLLPHLDISKMLSFRLDLVHGLDRYNGMVPPMRVTSQRINMHSIFYFALLYICAWHLYSPWFFGAFGVLHQSRWLHHLITSLILKAKPIGLKISLYFRQLLHSEYYYVFFFKFSSVISSW